MKNITFNDLPDAIFEIQEKLNSIEILLLKKYAEPTVKSDKILTVQEVASLLRRTIPTIYGLVHTKKIPYSKRGTRLYFSEREILDWVKSGRVKTNEEISLEADNYLKKIGASRSK